jgi:DNA-binding MarR family transcriptional regulator
MLSSPNPADLMIQLIDEMQRTRGRLASVTHAFSDPGGPVGLAMTVLTAVVRASHPPTVPQIGRSLGYPRQTVQRQAEDLVERGLIAFIDNPDHKRARRLVATGTGQATQDRASVRSLDWAANITQGLDPNDLAGAVAVLRTIRGRIESELREIAAAAPANDDNQDRE